MPSNKSILLVVLVCTTATYSFPVLNEAKSLVPRSEALNKDALSDALQQVIDQAIQAGLDQLIGLLGKRDVEAINKDALSDALQQVIDQAIQAGLDQLIGLLGKRDVEAINKDALSDAL